MNILSAMSDPVKTAKHEILKFDQFGKKGVPDAIEALDAVEVGLNGLADYVATFDEDEVVALFKMIESVRKPQNQAGDEKLLVMAKAIHQYAPVLKQAAQVVHGLDEDLKHEKG